MPLAACPDIGNLLALLEKSGGGEPDEVVRHLETCVDCQRTLETLAAEPVVWEDTAQGLVNAARKEHALWYAVEQLKKEEPLVGEDEKRSFLRPTNKPGLLGLLGQYEVQEEIGRGGMGVVFKALDPDLNRVVAIKVLSPWLASSATARRRFVREGRAAAAVCHDHLVTVYGVNEAEGLPYLVMQYVEGASLQTHLDRTGPLELVEVVQIGLQTATGLAAAHAQGLIHRDIKPANLLLENGLARVKITDFGLARLADDVALTQSGTVAGTPEYMAPEQAQGEAIDHRADLFSLGSVLYAMCTGVPPFRGSTPLSVLRRVTDEAPVAIRSLNPDVSDWLEAVIVRLMAKVPSDRFQSAAEVAALLEGYLAHLRQPTTVSAPELPFLPSKARLQLAETESPSGVGSWFRRYLWLVSLVLLAAWGLGIIYWFAGAVSETEPKTETVRDFYQSFEDNAEISPDLKLYGPEADQYVKFEPAGLHITLPPGYPGRRPGTGLVTAFGVKGDFEMTVGYEILKETEPPDIGEQTKLMLAVAPVRPAEPEAGKGNGGFRKVNQNMASLSRSMGPKGRTKFYTCVTKFDEETGKDAAPIEHEFLTKAKTGQLRLVRIGTALYYYVSEDSSTEFTRLYQDPFGGEDLKNVRIVGTTGGPRLTLDVRVTDFRIHAAALTKLSAAPAPKPVSRTLPIAFFPLMITLSLGIPFSVWLYLRQRRRVEKVAARVAVQDKQAKPETVSPAISFSCSTCGKNLKAKAELAGKKVKCSQCAKVVLVPDMNKVKP